MKELQGLFPDFVISNNEESIPHVKHDFVNIPSDSGTVYYYGCINSLFKIGSALGN